MSNTIVAVGALEHRVREKLEEAGASAASASAAVRALMHASIHGVDSHGVRLTEHYCRMLRGGRITKTPELRVQNKTKAAAIVDADNGLGHYAAYKAMEIACETAAAIGIAIVGVKRSSHFGAAGAYALAGAEAGFVTFVTTNTDSMVALYDGAARFHGTNPLAWAAPVPGREPWLLDMATSSIPMNKVMLHKSLEKALPDGVAADANGMPTTRPEEVDMLLPLGGLDYGYKGAGLGGVATLFSAILNGTTLDTDFIPMFDPVNHHEPRNMGHCVIAISPDIFISPSDYAASITRYMEAVKTSPTRPGGKVMTPGQREWGIRDARLRDGIPIDPDTSAFLEL